MTEYSARAVESNQSGVHDQLEKWVLRHLNKPFKRPIPAFSQAVFEQAASWLETQQRPIIFDSYCGVGESTAALAKLHPDCSIIGLDKSAHRLTKHEQQYRNREVDNYLLLRADVDDFWRLAVAAGWQLQHHYLLYPNPWPKSSHLKRRCHGSPLFPTLLALGGQLELRSNWPVYVEEFSNALRLAGKESHWQSFTAEPAITPFERKYQLAGQTLWHCRCDLSA